MIEKLETLLWFVCRPSHWAHAVELGLRKARPDRDCPPRALEAREWAAARAVTAQSALSAIGVLAPGEDIPELPPDLLAEGNARAQQSRVRMGGAGDLALLHAAVLLSGARRVVETGVAYGWSSLAILAALDLRDDRRLISVDMPYPKMNNEAFVGVVVPDRFRSAWQIVRKPDRYGLKEALALIGGVIDLCHYDSDKSYWGRAYAYPLLWDALVPGGVFISDDIQDNLAFRDFVNEKGVPFAITESEGKFVGILRKP